jgi:hypothetical protein
VDVGSNADNQYLCFALGIQQMPQVAGMNDIKGTMAHDDQLLARESSDQCANFLNRFNLVRKALTN